MHKCPVTTCEVVVPTCRLMCKPHWNLVPRDVQREIHAGYRDMRANKSVRRWVEAREMALRIIAHKTGDPTDA